MSILDKPDTPTTKKGLVITIMGDAGSGKTTLASTFPDAYYIKTQGEGMPRDAVEPANTATIGGQMTEDKRQWDENELFDRLMALVREDHPYKTVIIDSVTGLEDLFVSNILAVQPDKQKTMNAAGKGYASEWDTVRAKHGRVRKAAELLADRKGIHVVFIAHLDVDRVELPDTDPFSKYALQLNKKTAPIFINNVDVVAFLRQETFVVGDEGHKKAKTSGDRVAVVTMTPSGISKNRLGITEDLPFVLGENPFAAYI
jgi:GTPase SAR1 family protein